VLRPIIYKISGKEEREAKARAEAEAAEAAAAAAAAAEAEAEAMFDPDDPDAIVQLSGDPEEIDERAAYKANLESAKQWAMKDPKLVANIIKTWVNDE